MSTILSFFFLCLSYHFNLSFSSHPLIVQLITHLFMFCEIQARLKVKVVLAIIARFHLGRRGSFHVCLKAKMITKINTICVCQSNLFSQRPNVSKNFDIFCFWMHLILIVYGTKTVCTRNILLCPGLYLHWICSLEFLTFYKRNRFQARIDVDNTEIADKECFILFDFFESHFVYFCRYIRSF